jgi:hypothetical protein
LGEVSGAQRAQGKIVRVRKQESAEVSLDRTKLNASDATHYRLAA